MHKMSSRGMGVTMYRVYSGNDDSSLALFFKCIQLFSINATLLVQLLAASSPSHQHYCWKFCPYFRPRSNGISYMKVFSDPQICEWHLIPFLLTLILIHLSKYQWPLVSIFGSLLISTHAIIGKWYHPVTGWYLNHNYWIPVSFPQPWTLLDVLHCLVYIYTCISTEISNLTCAKQNFQYCPPKSFSSIPLDKSYFDFSFSLKPYIKYTLSKSPQLHLSNEENNTYISMTTRAWVTIVSSLDLCQSLLAGFSDSTPSPIFLHRTAGIFFSEFNVDNLILMLRTYKWISSHLKQKT